MILGLLFALAPPAEARSLRDTRAVAELIAGPLTPSPAMLAGDDFACRLLNDEPGLGDEFTRDARFDKLDEDERVMLRNMARGEVRGPISFQLAFVQNLSAEAGAPFPKFCVTWRSTGIRAINRLSDQRRYVVGLTDRDLRADGVTFTPKKFQEHDLSHAAGTESTRFGLISLDIATRPIKTAFFEALSYERITRGFDQREPYLFDLAYFLLMHEHPAKASLLAWQLISARTSFDLSRIERTATEFKWLGERWLDPSDLRVNLAVEIKAFLRERPDLGEAVVARLLDEAGRVFRRQLRDVTLKTWPARSPRLGRFIAWIDWSRLAPREVERVHHPWAINLSTSA